MNLQFQARSSLLVETSYAACDTAEVESPLISSEVFAEGFLISGKRPKRATRSEQMRAGAYCG